jgi:hypothetical protein
LLGLGLKLIGVRTTISGFYKILLIWKVRRAWILYAIFLVTRFDPLIFPGVGLVVCLTSCCGGFMPIAPVGK